VAALRMRKQEELMMNDKLCRLEADCISLEGDADELAEQAEKTSRLTLIAKSNALQLGAKTKRNEI